MGSVTIQLYVPDNWNGFRLPSALDSRIQESLDQQDQQGALSESEGQEAESLTEVVDMLALLKFRVVRETP